MQMSLRYCTGKRKHRCAAQRMRTPIYQQSIAVRDTLNETFNEQGNRGQGLNVLAPIQSSIKKNNTQTSDSTGGYGTLSRRSSLPANLHSAPANPTAVVNIADGRAQAFLDSAGVLTTLASFGLSQSINMAGNRTLGAYLSRFDRPEQVGRRYRNRFSGRTYASENDAQAHELDSLSSRYQRMSNYLNAGIRYISNSTTRTRIGRCRDRCSAHPGWVAWSCDDRRGHAIALCPSYWSLAGGDSQRAVAIVHELVHLRLQLRRHNAGNQRQRGRNPECYASFVADIFGITPFDGQCPPV